MGSNPTYQTNLACNSVAEENALSMMVKYTATVIGSEDAGSNPAMLKFYGCVAEWSIALVLKTRGVLKPPWVRILPHPFFTESSICGNV